MPDRAAATERVHAPSPPPIRVPGSLAASDPVDR